MVRIPSHWGIGLAKLADGASCIVQIVGERPKRYSRWDSAGGVFPQHRIASLEHFPHPPLQLPKEKSLSSTYVDHRYPPPSLVLSPDPTMSITNIPAGCAVSTVLLSYHTHFSTITEFPVPTSLALTCKLLYRPILGHGLLSLARHVPRLTSFPMGQLCHLDAHGSKQPNVMTSSGGCS